ncbi:phage virion morphogenesis protein [Palleronia caenipelagi]|uniref:Phage virion morphogenesis protein n=1 Tax=Palleronia caenipelagi TaxID=2489174 RepID=A0A547PW90_9RHOB|nr:phage virion morphogenesis protein [Palleronia caenipelagi]TRD18391.1 phage virion morphogenesis protein [Palleronia caenipelagi]
MSATLRLTTPGLDAALARLARLSSFEMASLADAAGALLESGARGRMISKEAPDGTPWADWSIGYAATRGEQHSLLVNEGDLTDSLASYATGDEVHVGSNLIYAAHHQIGGAEIGSGLPARPYLGLSPEDAIDLRDLVTGTLEGLFS